MTLVLQFHASFVQVSCPGSLGPGMVWNVQTSVPVRTLYARTAPLGPLEGYSGTAAPVITRSLKKRGCRRHSVLRLWKFICYSRTEIHDAIGAKTLTGLPTLRIKADQASIEGPVKDAPIISYFALPISNAAVLKEFPLGTGRLWIK